MTYDLRHAPWIACEFLDGTNRSVGFVEMFEKAHDIRLFHHDNPLAEAALMRILLALSHRILDGPADKKSWKSLYDRGKYDIDTVKAYFQKWHDRFDLFDEVHPFMQIAGLETLDNKGHAIKPALSTLVHHIASGNNATLFDHTLDAESPCFDYPDAAMVLFASLFYSLGGTHKKSSNLCGYQGNCKNGTGVKGLWAFVQGQNLFETLMLNTLIMTGKSPIPFTTQDAPFWEKPVSECGDTMPKGYLDYLTFTARLVRLIPEREGVRFAHFACGRSLNTDLDDPFKPLKVVKNDTKLLSATLEKALWRDSDALFHYGSEGFSVRPLEQLANIGRKIANRPYRITVYGLINDKANPKGYVKEHFPIPLSLLGKPELRETITQAIKLAETGYNKLYSAIKTFSENTEISMDMLKKRAAEPYWASLHLPFLSFLEHITESTDFSPWEQTIALEAKKAYETGIRSLVGNDARSIEAYVLGEKKLYFNKGGKP